MNILRLRFNGAPRLNVLAPHSLQFPLLGLAQKNTLATVVVHLSTSATAVCVVFSAHGTTPPWYIFWFGSIMALSAVRLRVGWLLGRALAAPREEMTKRIRHLALIHSGGLILSGLCWAVLAWVRLPVENGYARFIILIILAANAAGATGLLAPLGVTGAIYITLLTLPACLRLLVPTSPESILCLAGVVFWAVMVLSHRNNHALLVRSIRLGRENLNLVDELQLRNEEIEQINASLEARIEDRTRAFEDMAVKAQSASRTKSQFLATISHEIRTPLNGILGMAQVMERDDLAHAQAERLQVIQSSAKTLLSVVNDVLDISKIEAGQMEVTPVAFRLDHFALGMERLYGVLAREKGLQFSLTVSGDAAGWRYGDDVRLRQITSNLISNALKFTFAGKIEVDISARSDGLVLTVSDTGQGIAAKDQPLIFEKFVQADGSNTRRASGTGLGLAICRELTELMGGHIALTSTPGFGSVFVVTLPMPIAEPPAPRAEATGPSLMEHALRVLVVDDNPTNLLVVETLLGCIGVATATATNGLDAVKAWEDEAWDVILMDVNMPQMDGLEATRLIRAREIAGSRPRTPIIAVTASVMSHETQIYLAAGMDDVVAKPVDAKRLYNALEQSLTQEDPARLASQA